MRHFAKLLLALSLSVVLYLLVFILVVGKPISNGRIGGFIRHKTHYAKSVPSPKLVLLAFSNGRFSHSCETMEPILGMPCVNGGLSSGVGLDFLFDQFKPYLQSGDSIYIPLEYPSYKTSYYSMAMSTSRPYMVEFDRGSFFHLPFGQVLLGGFSFDLPFLLGGLFEMVADASGFQPRFDPEYDFNRQGDNIKMTIELGAQYRDLIKATKFVSPQLKTINYESYSVQILREFLVWAKENGIVVVGGLPTTFNDTPIPAEVIDRIATIYKEAGHRFLVLPNQSQYPRAYFYDSAHHLAHKYQILHSRKVANALAPILSVGAATDELNEDHSQARK